ncbi:sterol esterase [Mycena albidolilacea]|uniref:Sterol esterase n=1 Tax=Mycena albidolilacea TaxID=1033008 RepID=A0AAD6Z7S1_9AGAR|nr:sterol esterase [Mycena albidolilacea]
MIYTSLLISLFSFSSATGAATVSPRISLQYATFQGVNDGNLTKFLGVPFAQPVSRFEVPKPPTQLLGLQDATNFGPACPQQALDPIPAPFPLDNFTISEDCLTLNVFKPTIANSASKLPVFVWFFGGGFEIGDSSNTDVRSVVERSILTEQPVIIVTPNYRVSAFGFLNSKEMLAAGATNLGIRDQIAALEWVRRHIGKFGGDASKVVAGGVSSGAISTGILMMSNKFNTNILFRGAFLQSGSPTITGSVADGQPGYDDLVAANNCTGSRNTFDCLKDIPFDSFMATVNRTDNIFGFNSLSGNWRPRADGEVIAQDPMVSVSKGLYSKIPIMTGDSDDEGTIFAFGNKNITTNTEFLGYIGSKFLPKSSPEGVALIGSLYPEDPSKGSPFDTGNANVLTPEFKRLAAFQGDFVFLGPRRFFLEHASTRQNTGSWLNKRGKANPLVGAFHGSDQGIWFPQNTTDTVGVDALINFINTLDPNYSAARGASTHRTDIYWPQWKTRASSGSTSLSTIGDPLSPTSGLTSLLTFSDPEKVDITAEDFRSDAIRSLNNLVFEAAIAK